MTAVTNVPALELPPVTPADVGLGLVALAIGIVPGLGRAPTHGAVVAASRPQ